jgi:hypothetical protein
MATLLRSGYLLRTLWAACLLAACAVHAQTPATDNAGDKKVSGIGVIIRADSSTPQVAFEADGYRIRIIANTLTTFNDPLKALPDIGANTFVRYEGLLDQTGVLVATKADFYPAGYHKGLTSMGPRKVKQTDDYKPITKDTLIDAQGHFANPHTKVRYSDAGGVCGWHLVPADQALQERVERIGMRLVPAYQKALPADSPSRIPFRFYAVNDDKMRTVFACAPGLVLVPKNVVKRLQNDDQLASVLADGVSLNLMRQLFTMGPLEWSQVGAEAAEALPFLSTYLAGTAAEIAIGHEIALKLERQYARISLQLLANAEFDPRQAPEAWRLLEPKDPPSDLASLKYTREGQYQLRLLKTLYQHDAPGPASAFAPADATSTKP